MGAGRSKNAKPAATTAQPKKIRVFTMSFIGITSRTAAPGPDYGFTSLANFCLRS
jgi:hypothetical protein